MVATKYTLSAHSDAGVALTGNSRRNMILSVENSLRRLKTDHIDLLWAHFDDQLTPLEEIVRAFDDLIRSGKVMYGGLSNFPAWKISRADTLAELRGWSRIAGIQVEYSLAEHTSTALIPIIGSRTPAQLTDTLAALSVSLTDEHITRLENVSIIDYGTPHNQIAGTLPKAQGAGEYISIRPPRA